MIASFAGRLAALRLAVYRGEAQAAMFLAAALPTRAACMAIKSASLRRRFGLPAPGTTPATAPAAMVSGDDPDQLEQDE